MIDAGMDSRLAKLESELHVELARVADWWLRHVIDVEHGDVNAEVSYDNVPEPSKGKGLVFTARILWFFSVAFRHDPRDEYARAASLSLDMLLHHFPDAEFGGMYWSLDSRNQPDSMKKQSYGLAFAMYALTEHFLAFEDDSALEAALGLAETLEEHMRDRQYGGYLAALSRDWAALSDLRLGDDDANAEKTMNTHLHIMEAYTNLVRVTRGDTWVRVLRDQVTTFIERFVSAQGNHLLHYYTREWRPVPSGVSYGHDIEASWLLWEAARIIDDPCLIESTRQPVLELANAVVEHGIDEFGAVSNEILPCGHRDESRVWWVQAEAMVGFMNAWHMTGEQHYLNACLGVWEFIKQYQLDSEHGEWLWYSRLDRDAPPTYKAGRWKTPYHNGRALIEILNRLLVFRETGPGKLSAAIS